MDKDLEARMRTRAYHIREDDPSSEGRTDTHWEEARRQIEAEGDGAAPEPTDQSIDRDRGVRIAPEQRSPATPGGDAEPPRHWRRAPSGSGRSDGAGGRGCSGCVSGVVLLHAPLIAPMLQRVSRVGTATARAVRRLRRPSFPMPAARPATRACDTSPCRSGESLSVLPH
nr:DUF2934 domain-containing protein [Burkholderia sp. SRS-W-2-2016]